MFGLEQGTQNLLKTWTLAGGGISLIWMLAATLSRGKTGWLSAVVAPAMLAGYSQFASPFSSVSFLSSGVPGIIGMAVAFGAGVIFDRGSMLADTKEGLQGKQSPWPFLLWVLGGAAHCLAPLGQYIPDWQFVAERCGGALLLVSSGTLAGQCLCWTTRLMGAKKVKAPQSGAGVGGLALAAVALILILIPVIASLF